MGGQKKLKKRRTSFMDDPLGICKCDELNNIKKSCLYSLIWKNDQTKKWKLSCKIKIFYICNKIAAWMWDIINEDPL